MTWTESEAGWGQRPDGCSIHLQKEDIKPYVQAYWDTMPDEVQEEYSRPDNNPREVTLSEKLYKEVENTKSGLRLWQYELKEKKEKNEILFKD